jgi:xylan 1,4-beta-xylosidase
MHYTNPIIPGFHPDPSICRVGVDYFLVTSSFEYFPGVPLFHSRDLVHWRKIGHVLTRPSQLPADPWRPSGGIYAPTLRYHAGTFYMVTTNTSTGGNFYVHTRDPYGEWSDPTWIKQGGIDPSLFFDDDGRIYLTSTAEVTSPLPAEIDPAAPFFGIQQSEIDIATGTLLTAPRVIWRGTGGRWPEGPHLYKIGGRYYLMIAEGGTEQGHMETIARGDNPWGPWENCPHNPILSHRSLHSPLQALGHADLCQAHDGTWWLVCLGIRTQGYPPTAHLGRETLLAPVVWDGAGWPHAGQEGKLRVEMEDPTFAATAADPVPVRDDFDAPTLGVEWIFLGTPTSPFWSLTDRPGALRLQGSAATLDDGPPVAFVARRQAHFTCEAVAQLDFEPQTDGEEAGLTVWMNPHHHYDLFVSRRASLRHVAVRRRIGSLVAEVTRAPIPPGPVTLTITAEPDRYTFAVTGAMGEAQTLATAEPRYLAPEVAGGFTGVCFALYTTGGGRTATTPAHFYWFDYRTP